MAMGDISYTRCKGAGLRPPNELDFAERGKDMTGLANTALVNTGTYLLLGQ